MSARKMKAGLPVLAFSSAREWEEWLSRQPRTSQGAWLKLPKKQSGIQSVTRREAIDGALCHGWIDGQLEKFDERYWLVRYTPRSARSKSSAINKTRAQELIREGRMKPAGLAEVNRAKADGRGTQLMRRKAKPPFLTISKQRCRRTRRLNDFFRN